MEIVLKRSPITLSILFYLKKHKPDKVGRVMINLLIIVNAKRSEFSTGRKVYPNRWDAINGKVVGFSQNIHQLNSHLMKIRKDLYRCG